MRFFLLFLVYFLFWPVIVETRPKMYSMNNKGGCDEGYSMVTN